MIKSVETIDIEAVRKIDKMLTKASKKHKHIQVYLHPDINAELISDQASMLSDIQRKYRCKVDLKADRSLHIEDVLLEEK